jgi:hypothetical protein
MPRADSSPSRPDLRRKTIVRTSPEIIVTAYTSHVEEIRTLRSSRERVANLLNRYPDVTEKDRKEILTFIKEGRHVDIGLLTADDKLRPRLDAFMADHKRHFSLGTGEIVRALAVIAAILMVCWLLWELVRPASMG